MAPNKFGRNYILNIETQSGATLTVKPPFTVEFDITRNVLTSANVCQIRIYNLNANNRSQIRKNINDTLEFRSIQLLAGYGNNLSLCFSGNVTQAWSVREGVNFISQIECFDGGYALANATSNITVPSGAEQKAIAEALINDLAGSGVSPGVVGNIEGFLSRGNAYSGQTCNILQQITNGAFYIDNGKAYILADNECLEGPLTTINAKSGLLNTPTREQTVVVNLEMLFEPKLIIGQKITLDSLTADRNINGDYKVISLKHRGMISEAVCGSAITSVGLLQPLGLQKLTTVGVA